MKKVTLLIVIAILLSCNSKKEESKKEKILPNTVEDSLKEKHSNINNSCSAINLYATWVDNDDSLSLVTINKNEMINTYDNEVMSVLSYSVTNISPVKDINEKISTCYLIANEKDGSSSYSYEIMSVSSTTLTLMYLDRGNILVYKKKND